MTAVSQVLTELNLSGGSCQQWHILMAVNNDVVLHRSLAKSIERDELEMEVWNVGFMQVFVFPDDVPLTVIPMAEQLCQMRLRTT